MTAPPWAAPACVEADDDRMFGITKGSENSVDNCKNLDGADIVICDEIMACVVANTDIRKTTSLNRKIRGKTERLAEGGALIYLVWKCTSGSHGETCLGKLRESAPSCVTSMPMHRIGMSLSIHWVR